MTRAAAKPAVPARPTAADKEARKAYTALGQPPEDPLEAYTWALRALEVSLHHVLHDSKLTERERRKEMREITRAMAGLEPKARLYDAEERVRGDQARLDENRTGPEMIDAAELAGQAYRASATRGRPRR